jgi:hypothetical protein
MPRQAAHVRLFLALCRVPHSGHYLSLFSLFWILKQARHRGNLSYSFGLAHSWQLSALYLLSSGSVIGFIVFRSCTAT